MYVLRIHKATTVKKKPERSNGNARAKLNHYEKRVLYFLELQ